MEIRWGNKKKRMSLHISSLMKLLPRGTKRTHPKLQNRHYLKTRFIQSSSQYLGLVIIFLPYFRWLQITMDQVQVMEPPWTIQLFYPATVQQEMMLGEAPLPSSGTWIHIIYLLNDLFMMERPLVLCLEPNSFKFKYFFSNFLNFLFYYIIKSLIPLSKFIIIMRVIVTVSILPLTDKQL